jgi:hypothetical protein
MRASGPINFSNMSSAIDGVAALRDAGFEAELDHDRLELDGSEAFGAVWCDVEGLDNLSELHDRIPALLAPYGDCFEFGIGSETAVWRD